MGPGQDKKALQGDSNASFQVYPSRAKDRRADCEAVWMRGSPETRKQRHRPVPSTHDLTGVSCTSRCTQSQRETKGWLQKEGDWTQVVLMELGLGDCRGGKPHEGREWGILILDERVSIFKNQTGNITKN